MARTLTIVQPDDWHLHLRDVPAMNSVAPLSSLHFARAVIMPNLTPPITTTEQVGSDSLTARVYVIQT